MTAEMKDRFRLSREHAKLSQADLSDLVSVSSVAISKVEQGKTVSPRKIELFAKYLNVSPEWLQYGVNPPRWFSPDSNSEHQQALNLLSVREVPIVSWVSAGDFCGAEAQLPKEDFELIICPEQDASERTFALRVIGDSMTNPYGRSYPEGSIIYVDPLKVASPGERVIARISKGHTFKELVVNEFGEQYLRPLNPAHQPIFDKEIEVCGVVIGSYFKE